MTDAKSYDKVVVSFSGGKDSIACVKAALDAGVDRSRMELWHQCVDGKDPEGYFMDWPVTEDYVRKVGAALGIPVYYQWKEGGFAGELWREDRPTNRNLYETPEGDVRSSGGKGKPNTRKMFPQVSADLTQRWCSAYLKCMPCEAAIRGMERFRGIRTLLLTGERAEESKGRAGYAQFEVDRADARGPLKRRHVDRWRPVHQWKEASVWEAVASLGIVPHPAYRMGWGRLSCMSCIFGNRNQWASVRAVAPEAFRQIAEAEARTGKTIHRSKSVDVLAGSGEAYAAVTRELALLAMGRTYRGGVLDPAGWSLPAGAFGEKDGPT
jgi:3'-phosphoadenosine 5'-phosphosulfate sulfotransferase (PAPS reductase)/FAD synthetase